MNRKKIICLCEKFLVRTFGKIMVPIFVVGFIVDHYCLSIYIWPLLFILLLMPIIVYPFIDAYYCRPLLFILLLSPIIVVHYCLSYYCQPLFFILLWSTIIVYPFIFGHYWASIKNISVCPNLTRRCEVRVGR